MATSPFKFLNAFEKEDFAYFFGREEEIKDLYEMTYDTRLILLYGASGTGKTSLVQCGLANKFWTTRWKDIFIRRGININEAITQQIQKEYTNTGANSLGKAVTNIEKIEGIYRVIFKPIFLVFDQFEELFLVNPDEQEQIQFFNFLKALLESKMECKIILIMREEFIAHLWNFEHDLPTLFDHRYRIETMRFSKAKQVIKDTLIKLSDEQAIVVKGTENVSNKILEKLTKGKQKLELTYLQVYLDRLFQVAELTSNNKPLFTVDLVEKVGTFEDIIGEFLSTQLLALEQKLGKTEKGIPLKILGSMITSEKTKKVLNALALEQIRLENHLSKEDFYQCIQAFESMRILKRHE